MINLKHSTYSYEGKCKVLWNKLTKCAYKSMSNTFKKKKMMVSIA